MHTNLWDPIGSIQGAERDPTSFLSSLNGCCGVQLGKGKGHTHLQKERKKPQSTHGCLTLMLEQVLMDPIFRHTQEMIGIRNLEFTEGLTMSDQPDFLL